MEYDPSYSAADVVPGQPMDPSEHSAYQMPQATQSYTGDILPTKALPVKRSKKK